MTDPWYIAAQQIRANRVTAAQAAADAATARRAEVAAINLLERQEEAALQALIDEVTPELEAFVAQRGAAARHLLGASETRKLVLFGTDSDGSDYDTVGFDEQGFARFTGSSNSYGFGVTNPRQPVKARRAVEYFARYGAGRNAPENVRAIVSWFENEINQRMPQ